MLEKAYKTWFSKHKIGVKKIPGPIALVHPVTGQPISREKILTLKLEVKKSAIKPGSGKEARNEQEDTLRFSNIKGKKGLEDFKNAVES